jgi:hypothetical protein
MTQVPGVLLDQVEQDPFQGRGVGAVPAVAGFPDLVEVVGLHDGAGPPGLIEQVGHEAGQGLLGSDRPAAISTIGPRVGDLAALEAPLEPAQLHVPQVLGQLERRPAGGEPAAAQLGGGQRLQLAGQPGPEIVQVADEDLGARAGRSGRLGKRHGDGSALPGWAWGKKSVGLGEEKRGLGGRKAWAWGKKRVGLGEELEWGQGIIP